MCGYNNDHCEKTLCECHATTQHKERDWEDFVAFVQPFKNRAYTQDTADETVRRTTLLLTKAREDERERVATEERQFILNILDGIDIADKAMGNIGGGTKAIRFALQSRYLPPHQQSKECCEKCNAKGKRGAALYLKCMHPHCPNCHQKK